MKGITILCALLLVTVFAVGCSEQDAPTAAIEDADLAAPLAPDAAAKHAVPPSLIYEFHIATTAFICLFETFPGEFCPAIAVAASNGDTLEITEGEGTFNTQTKAASGGGDFVHKNAAGVTLATGTWEATKLLSFHDWGPSPLPGFPPLFRAGLAQIRVRLTPAVGAEVDAILRVTCRLEGVTLPPSFVEGFRLNILGGLNFNTQGPGGTLFCPDDCNP